MTTDSVLLKCRRTRNVELRSELRSPIDRQLARLMRSCEQVGGQQQAMALVIMRTRAVRVIRMKSNSGKWSGCFFHGRLLGTPIKRTFRPLPSQLDHRTTLSSKRKERIPQRDLSFMTWTQFEIPLMGHMEVCLTKSLFSAGLL